jgi:hypothetical protein
MGGPKVHGGLGLSVQDPVYDPTAPFAFKTALPPVMKDRASPNLSEDQAAEAAAVPLPNQKKKIPWVLLGIAAFFLMKPAWKGSFLEW